MPPIESPERRIGVEAAGSQSRVSGLPLEPTRFVGREHELDAVRRLLDSTRLLTLTGAGGSGKTRLAHEVVTRMLSEGTGANDVAWIELASLRTPDLLPQHVGTSLGLRMRGARSAPETLVRGLRSRPLLIVLDNCEHLADACATLADSLLRGCPEIRILATSREALRISGETAWLVPTLSLPQAGFAEGIEAANRSEAVRLFVDRAQAALPSFELTTDNVAAVAQICQRLDGLPLAIELAAARMRVLSPRQIAGRLEDGFQVLSTRGRTTVPRHRTLREAIGWSYDLLEEREQLLLRRLSVFAGGFSLEAAESICTADALSRGDVLDVLSALVDKSLVVTATWGDENRYRLLETVRQYAFERLCEAGKPDFFQRRHAEYFLALAEAAEPHIFAGSDEPSWTSRLDSDLTNLRAAAEWFEADPAGADAALRLATALDWFWFANGQFGEARRWLEAGLRRAEGSAPSLIRARALSALGYHEFWRGDYKAMAAPLEASAALLRGLSTPRELAYALSGLGTALSLAGDSAEAEASLQEAVTIARTQDRKMAAWCLGLRGMAAQRWGEYDAARTSLEEAIELGRSAGLKQVVFQSTLGLGRVAWREGNLELARVCFEEAMRVRGPKAEWWGVMQVLDAVAAIAIEQGRPEEAARLLGAADLGRERTGTLPGAGTTAEQLQVVTSAARAALGESAYTSAWEAGRTLSLEQAVEYAFESTRQRGAAAAVPSLRVSALGPLEIQVDGRRVPSEAWPYGKPRELLIYLLCHPGGHTREQIGLAFWPEATSAQVKNNFHVTLHHLRKALERPDWIVFENDRYRLRPGRDYEFDVSRFETEAANALSKVETGNTDIERLQSALALYRGDFLQDEIVGDWHLEHRDRLRELYVDVSSALGRQLMASEAFTEAAEIYARVVRLDDLNEDAHRRLMLCQARAGERSRALRHFERLVEMLREELDASPEPETVALYERLRKASTS